MVDEINLATKLRMLQSKMRQLHKSEVESGAFSRYIRHNSAAGLSLCQDLITSNRKLSNLYKSALKHARSWPHNSALNKQYSKPSKANLRSYQSQHSNKLSCA